MLHITDTKILIKLAAPLIISGVIEASLGFSSTLFLAHLGEYSLAAGSLVAWFFATLMVIFWGLFSAVSVLVANYRGAGDNRKNAFVMRDSLWLAVFFAIPTGILVWNMAPILYALGQPKSLVQTATPYLHALTWGVLPDFIGFSLMQFVVGLEHMKTNLVFTLSWVITNIIANYALMFGHFGLPALGIAGLGWGTSFAFWLTTCLWLLYMLSRQHYRGYFRYIFNWQRPYYFLELIKVGIPTGLMWCVEVAFFLVISLFLGHISVMLLAASQVAIQYLSLFVAVLFAIAQALTVRVSNRLGAGENIKADNAVHSGLFIALFLMGILALIAWLFPNILVSIDFGRGTNENIAVINHAKTFLKISVIFLLMEAVRITLFGALRGYKLTTVTLLSSFLSFWCIAIPLGYILAYNFALGGIGFWYGLLVGGAFGAIFLWWRYNKTNKP